MSQFTAVDCNAAWAEAVARVFGSSDTAYLHSIYFPEGTDCVNGLAEELALTRRSAVWVVNPLSP